MQLNGRFFCADCGSDAEHRLHSFTPKPPTRGPSNRPGEHHVLDLTSGPPQAASVVAGPSHQPTLPPTQTEQHVGSKTAAPGAPKIARFHKAKTAPAQPIEPVAPPVEVPLKPALPAKSMLPHSSYSLSEKKGDIAAMVATYHGRHEMKQAAAEPASVIQPGQVSMPKQQRWGLKLPNPFQTLISLPYARVIAISLSMVMLTGYVTYLNYPNIALRVAAGRAGITASMPGYTPSGYNFKGPIGYGSSRLSINFRNKKDEQLTLAQSRTNWDSASLFENVVKTASDNYQAFQENGLTIYVYDTTATWVNGGVWYTITGSSSLDPNEIVKMASSL